MKISVVSVIALMTIEASAFWRLHCQDRVSLQRQDPIISPNKLAAHVHTIHGPDTFSSAATADDLLKAKCTSCEIKQDFSAYWTPVLYFKDEKGTYTEVGQEGGMLVYYLLRGSNIKALPNGFRLVAGDPSLRSFPYREVEKSHWKDEDRTETVLRQKAIGFNCLNYKAPAEAALGLRAFPQKTVGNCANGVRTEVLFPSCWDGKNLGTGDYKDHMRYPDLLDDGNCPKSHPVRVPTLFFETIWKTYDFAGKKGEFVFSNGDPTGYGYHGDLLVAWEDGFLQQAVDKCTNLSGLVSDCPLFKTRSLGEMQQCKAKDEFSEFIGSTGSAAFTGVAAETLSTGLTSLPGCVEVSYGPGKADITNKCGVNGTPLKDKVVSSPKIELPKIELPKVELPKVTLPKNDAEVFKAKGASDDVPSVKPLAVVPAAAPAIIEAPKEAPKEEVKPTPSTTAAPSPTPSFFIKDGVKVFVEVVTSTITVTSDIVGPSPAAVKRHAHAHAHGHHWRRAGRF